MVNTLRISALRAVLIAATAASLLAVPAISDSASASDAPTVKVSQRRVFPSASDSALRALRVTVESSTLPVRVSLMRSTTVIATKTITVSGTRVSFATSALRTGAYTVVANDGSDSTSVRVRVDRGWAPMDRSLPSWQRCRVITWNYDSSRAPEGGSVYMVRDIRTTFETMSQATGIRFTRVTDDGDIEVRWGDAGGADGVGQLAWSGGPGGVTSGYIELNTASEWAKTPGTGNRGVLLLHESAHVFGLGHVAIDTTLMSPTFRPGITNPTLGAGEKAGFTSMYHPLTCD